MLIKRIRFEKRRTPRGPEMGYRVDWILTEEWSLLGVLVVYKRESVM